MGAASVIFSDGATIAGAEVAWGTPEAIVDNDGGTFATVALSAIALDSNHIACSTAALGAMEAGASGITAVIRPLVKWTSAIGSPVCGLATQFYNNTTPLGASIGVQNISATVATVVPITYAASDIGSPEAFRAAYNAGTLVLRLFVGMTSGTSGTFNVDLDSEGASAVRLAWNSPSGGGGGSGAFAMPVVLE